MTPPLRPVRVDDDPFSDLPSAPGRAIAVAEDDPFNDLAVARATPSRVATRSEPARPIDSSVFLPRSAAAMDMADLAAQRTPGSFTEGPGSLMETLRRAGRGALGLATFVPQLFDAAAGPGTPPVEEPAPGQSPVEGLPSFGEMINPVPFALSLARLEPEAWGGLVAGALMPHPLQLTRARGVDAEGAGALVGGAIMGHRLPLRRTKTRVA